MSKQTIHDHLDNLEACSEARHWASQFATAQEVFDNCARVDWLFWWCSRLGQINQCVKAAREIAESVVALDNYFSKSASYAASAAAYAAADAAASAAAAYAAASAATYAAAAAADAAASAAAMYAAADAARSTQQQLNLSIARKYLTLPWTETNE